MSIKCFWQVKAMACLTDPASVKFLLFIVFRLNESESFVLAV